MHHRLTTPGQRARELLPALLEWGRARSGADRAPSPRVISGAEIAPEVISRVVDEVVAASRGPRGAPLVETVHETLYTETRRLAAEAPGGRRAADQAFVASLRHALPRAGEAELARLVRQIVARYAAEISGRFDPKVYAVATRVLPHALARLLGGGELDQRLLFEGEVEALRSAASRGTVALVPTHVSNLDSLLMGWAIYRLGLPPFAYAAGLNLFFNGAIGFFMNHLGAYTVDRQKHDPLYVATLKEYATALLARGQHGLWFPGGTRSRSGAVERHLKLGLLGTLPAALQRSLAAGRQGGMYVVPCTLTYPLVLEASSLVAEFLRREGGPHYVELEDEFSRPRRWAAFFKGLAALDLQVHVRFGAPMDVVGNPIDAEGRSLDPKGRPIDVRGYLSVNGRLAADPARDAEYTREVGERVTAAWRRDTVALPTSVLAWAVFERARRERPQVELFRLLRGLGPHTELKLDALCGDVERLIGRLGELAAAQRVRLAPELLPGRARDVVERALKTFATYHPAPVLRRRGAAVAVLDPNLLYYYRNRLDGLPLSEEERA